MLRKISDKLVFDLDLNLNPTNLVGFKSFIIRLDDDLEATQFALTTSATIAYDSFVEQLNGGIDYNAIDTRYCLNPQQQQVFWQLQHLEEVVNMLGGTLIYDASDAAFTTSYHVIITAKEAIKLGYTTKDLLDDAYPTESGGWDEGADWLLLHVKHMLNGQDGQDGHPRPLCGPRVLQLRDGPGVESVHGGRVFER